MRVSHQRAATEWMPASKDAQELGSVDELELRRAAGARGKKKKRRGRKK